MIGLLLLHQQDGQLKGPLLLGGLTVVQTQGILLVLETTGLLPQLQLGDQPRGSQLGSHPGNPIADPTPGIRLV